MGSIRSIYNIQYLLYWCITFGAVLLKIDLIWQLVLNHCTIRNRFIMMIIPNFQYNKSYLLALCLNNNRRLNKEPFQFCFNVVCQISSTHMYTHLPKARVESCYVCERGHITNAWFAKMMYTYFQKYFFDNLQLDSKPDPGGGGGGAGLQITTHPLANATKCCLWTTRNQKLVAHLATRIQGE